MFARRFWVSYLVSIAIACPGAEGGPKKGKRQRPPKGEPPVPVQAEPLDEGIEFTDPLVAESVTLLKQEKTDEAVGRLDDAIKGRHGPKITGDQLNELRLGLGMVYLRSGQLGPARKTLTPLRNMKDGSLVVPKARVLQKILNQSNGSPLTTAETWVGALTKVVRQSATSLPREHDGLSQAISKQKWKAAIIHGTNASQLLEEICIVRLTAINDLPNTASRQYVETIAAQVGQINNYCDLAIRDARHLDSLIKQRAESGGRMFVDPNIQKYNRMCNNIRQAWEVGKQLISEYQRVQNHFGHYLPFDHEVTLKIPEYDLPRPIG